MQYTIPIVNDI